MSDRKSLVSGIASHAVSAQAAIVKQFVKTGEVDSEIPLANQIHQEVSPPTAEVVVDAVERSPSGRKRPPQHSSTSEKSSRVAPIGLVPVTVRLLPELAGALKRASLERQLNGVSTFTQQEIVQQLLEPWLKKEGYL